MLGGRAVTPREQQGPATLSKNVGLRSELAEQALVMRLIRGLSYIEPHPRPTLVPYNNTRPPRPPLPLIRGRGGAQHLPQKPLLRVARQLKE